MSFDRSGGIAIHVFVLHSAQMGARLGQHFLKAEWAARALVNAVPTLANETIVEIGPGTGALTRILLETGAPVFAIEKDESLAQQLSVTFAQEVASGNLTIITGDVRDFSPDTYGITSYVVAANIPYYITGEIIRMFLTAHCKPRAMALLIQKEVAQRIVARDGKESILSLSVKAFGKPSVVAKVGKGAFSPPPKVDSAILLITDISQDFFDHIQEVDFFSVVRAGFASKRKKVLGNLEKVFGARTRELLSHANVTENARAEDLVLSDWKRITYTLFTGR